MKDCADRTCNFCNLQMFHETPWTIATGHQISKEVDDEERQALPGTASKQCSTDHEGNTWQRMFPCSHSIHHVPQWYQWYPQIQVKAPALKLVSRHVMSISGMNCWWRVCRRPVISTHQSFPNRPTRDATERTTVDKPEMSMSLTDTSVRDAILRNNTRKRNKCIIIAIIIHGDRWQGRRFFDDVSMEGMCTPPGWHQIHSMPQLHGTPILVAHRKVFI